MRAADMDCWGSQLATPISGVAWNTMRFQVFRDTLAKHREVTVGVTVGGNSWGPWQWKKLTDLIRELEVDLWFVAILEFALYLFAFIYNWCQLLIVGAGCWWSHKFARPGRLTLFPDWLVHGPQLGHFRNWAYCTTRNLQVSASAHEFFFGCFLRSMPMVPMHFLWNGCKLATLLHAML